MTYLSELGDSYFTLLLKEAVDIYPWRIWKCYICSYMVHQILFLSIIWLSLYYLIVVWLLIKILTDINTMKKLVLKKW